MFEFIKNIFKTKTEEDDIMDDLNDIPMDIIRIIGDFHKDIHELKIIDIFDDFYKDTFSMIKEQYSMEDKDLYFVKLVYFTDFLFRYIYPCLRKNLVYFIYKKQKNICVLEIQESYDNNKAGLAILILTQTGYLKKYHEMKKYIRYQIVKNVYLTERLKKYEYELTEAFKYIDLYEKHLQDEYS